MPATILVVDDDPRVRTSLHQALATAGMTVHAAEDAERALAMLAEVRPDVVLADVRMPGMSGLELLRLLKERRPATRVALMTAFDDLPTVAAAMREGAADFLVKPLDLHRLRELVARMIADRRAPGTAAAREHATPPVDVPERAGARDRAGSTAPSVPAAPPGMPDLVGRDPWIVEIFKVVGQVAATSANVLIRGESGTGKELIARAIHAASPRAAEPFVAVNCTALPATLLESELFGHVRGSFTGAAADRRGRFALAGRGTILLDEIGDTSPDFQAKLLRVLQEHEFYPVGAERPQTMAARVIAATHRDLEAMVRAGEFRRDLYYRLRVVELTIPPLRDRPGDVPVLAEHLVRKAAAALGRAPPALSPEASAALLRHAWPGNVRELENCLTRAVVLCTGDVIRPEHLAIDGPAAPAIDAGGDAAGAGEEAGLAPLADVECRHVARVLRATGWHKARAAELLGISRPRLDRLIRRYRLRRPEALDDGAAPSPPPG